MTKERMKKIVAIMAAVACIGSATGCSFIDGIFGDKKAENEPIILKELTQAKNVILMIGDGMGPNQVRAGELVKGKKLNMQNFPYSVKVETHSASDVITDSAAAATALATGVRTENGRIGMDWDDNVLETIVDVAAGLGKRTGVITTEELYGATPMGFSSHNLSRSNTLDLLTTAVESSNVNLFFSHKFSQTYLFNGSKYTQIKDPNDISESTEEYIYGATFVYAEAEPMTVTKECVALDGLVLEALEYLSKDEDGFFLMTEGAHIDHGGHNSDFDYMVSELLAFDAAVGTVLEWAKGRDDTVVIVTADHETGGLRLSDDATSKNIGEFGTYKWDSSGHTAADVWCFINGANINFANYSLGTNDRIQNIDVFKIMKSLLTGE